MISGMLSGFTAVIANLPLSSMWFQIDEVSLSYRGRDGRHLLPVSRISGFLYINGANCEFLLPQHVQRRSSVLTFIFTPVGKQQTAVLTFCLELREPLFDRGQAEVLSEEGVAGEGGKERSVLSRVHFAWWRWRGNVPSYNQDVVVNIEVFHCKLQAGHSTQTTLKQTECDTDPLGSTGQKGQLGFMFTSLLVVWSLRILTFVKFDAHSSNAEL